MRRSLALLAIACATAACAESPEASCDAFDAAISRGEIQRAPFGVRIVAPVGFVDYLDGPTFPISTGTLVMEPWEIGGRLGAIGIDAHGACYWTGV